MNHNRLVVELPITIGECLRCISSNAAGMVFLTQDFKLIGAISDGDVRRALLDGVSIDDSAEAIVNRKVVTLSENSNPKEVHTAFSLGRKLVPLISSDRSIIKILKIDSHNLIPVSEPNLGYLETEYLNDAMKSGWISSAGNYVGMFESNFSNYIESSHALAVANGTLGLVLALKMLEIGPGDEVLVPNLTFGATANAVVQVGAVPVFVDVNRDDLCMDVSKLKNLITPKTRAIIPVHLYGYAADIINIVRIAKEFNLYVIEDAAEALGTKVSGKHVGTFGHIGVFSFFANKLITTGEGGMLTFNDEKLLKKGKLIRSHGFSEANRYWHESWGTNLRITNIQAAIGCAQLERIEELLSIKKATAKKYRDLLSNMTPKHITFLVERPSTECSHWLNVIKTNDRSVTKNLSTFLIQNQIETRPIFYPLNTQPAFRQFHSTGMEYPQSFNAHEVGLCLPSSTLLTIDQIQRVCFQISRFFEKDFK